MPPKFSKELESPISYDAQPPKEQPRTSPCEANCLQVMLSRGRYS